MHDDLIELETISLVDEMDYLSERIARTKPNAIQRRLMYTLGLIEQWQFKVNQIVDELLLRM